MASLNDHVICAIDPSISCTGIAIFQIVDLEGKKFKLIEKTSLINKKTFPNRWDKKEATRHLFEFYLKDKIKKIALFIIENYSYGSKGYLSDAGEQIGLFKHYIWSNGKIFDMVAPATVKRIVGGSGLASKEQVAEGLKNFLVNYKDFKFNNTDETDAVAVGIAYLIALQEPKNVKLPRSRKNKKGDRKDRPSTKRKSIK